MNEESGIAFKFSGERSTNMEQNESNIEASKSSSYTSKFLFLLTL